MSVFATIEALQDMLAPAKRYDRKANRILLGRALDRAYLNHVPRIICADGLSFSMQASSGHYCDPRDSIGPWNEVEIGFPSERVGQFIEYAEDPERPTETVYGWVPLPIVCDVINAHGGFSAQVPQ